MAAALPAFVTLTAYAQSHVPDIEMVAVQGGTFTMGDLQNRNMPYSPNIRHVTLDGFCIGKYEVTQAQWVAVTGGNPSYFKDPEKPVEQVSWDDIVGTSGTVLYTEKGVSYRSDGFCGRLYKKTGKKYRLPTEAEREFAARGGNHSKGYKYSGSDNPDNVSWHSKNSDKHTHYRGTKQANELGIYDMSGNVLEWCSDFAGSYSSEPQINPIGASSGIYHAMRGGACTNDPVHGNVCERISTSTMALAATGCSSSMNAGIAVTCSMFRCRSMVPHEHKLPASILARYKFQNF